MEFTNGKNWFFVGLLNSVLIGIIMWVFIILLIMLIFGGCKSNEYMYTKRDPVDPRVTVQYDKKGNVEGTFKQSPIDPRVTIYRKKK